MAIKEAMAKGKPILLEPIMDVDATAPSNCVGDVIGDLNRRRGCIMGQETNKGVVIVSAEVPLSEMSGYSTDIRSITSGRGSFSMEPKTFKKVPDNIKNELTKK